jgi:hypothetical protein
MRRMVWTCSCAVALWAIASLCPLALAQKTEPADANSGPVLPTAKDLAFLLGNWETNFRVYPTEITPDGIKGNGTLEYRLFGQAIEGKRTSESTRGHYEDRELIAYDEGTNAYQILTVSNMGKSTQRTLSRYVDIWVLEHNGRQGEKEFRVRGKYLIVSANEVHYTSEINIGKSGFKPFSEVILKRAAAHN